MEGGPSTREVREDFDRLAVLCEDGGWDHTSYYHDLLLGRLPTHLAQALEVGCGTGAFARRLADRRSPELRRAWEEQVLTDAYPTLEEARWACRENLPGARVRRHLLRRYSVTWNEPVR